MSVSHTFVTKIVQAGAGTGKTESLAREIVTSARAFLEAHRRAPYFVASTFTERATAELRERVLLIAEKPEFATPELLQFVKDQERLQITTLHGVFARVLHQYGALTGIDPEFTILSEDDENTLLQKVTRKVLSQDREMDFLVDQYGFTGLTDLLKPLVNHYRLHKKNFDPVKNWRELLAQETQSLMASFKEVDALDLFEATPAAMKTLSTLKTLSKNLSRLVLDFPKFRSEFLAVLKELKKPPMKGSLEFSKPIIDHIFEFKERWQEETYSFEINTKYDEVSQCLKKSVIQITDSMNELKKNRGVLSFSDLEFLTAEILEKFPQVKGQISSHYDFWFIDEYQDTSPLQKQILFSFFKKPWNAYFVGDPGQSIYLFRGADQSVFEETKNLVKQQGGLLEKLDTNYRSEPDLLSFMNTLFSPLKAKGEAEGGRLAQIHLHAKEISESSLVIQQVLQWKSEGFEFQDVCVLTRTNENAENLAHALSRAGIPVFVHTTGGFYDKREILDALSLLAFLNSPQDDLLFATLARSPWFQISDEELLHWARSDAAGKNLIWEKHFSLQKLKVALDSQGEKPLSVVFEDLLNDLGFFELSTVGDSSGRREANLRKLVSQLRQAETRPGFSAAAFISKSWPSKKEKSEESEAASFIEPSRVNLMTIHKSKGLKFNCVIVTGCGKETKINHNAVETSPDGRFATLILADKTEEKISPVALKILKAERAEREMNESMRLFYVAVTRAAKRLSLISTFPFSERSWFAKTSLDFKSGDHPHYKVTSWTEQPENLKWNIEKTEESVPTVFDTIRASQTSIEFKDFDMSVDLQVLLDSQQRGIILHAVFEEIKKRPELSFKDVIDQTLSRFHSDDLKDRSVIEKTLALQDPPVMEIMKNGFAEWAFSFMEDGRVFSGRIDLWGIVGDTVWILDFKSAKQISQSLKESVSQQLRFYAVAIHKTGVPWEKIKLAALLPLAEEVYFPELGRLKDAVSEVVQDYRYLDRILRDQTAAQFQNL